MAKRYEQIKINDLSVGRGQLYHDPLLQKFSDSEGVDVDTVSGRLKLVSSFDSLSKEDTWTHNFPGQFLARQYSSGTIYTFWIYYDSASTQVKLSRFSTNTIEIAVKSFGVTYTEIYYFLAYKNLLIAEYKISGVVNIGYSIDAGVNFIDAVWTYGKIIGHTINQDNDLLVITDTGYVVKTSDGINWTQVFYDSTVFPSSIEYLDGFIYMIITDSNGIKSNLVRLDDEEIEMLVDLHTEFSPATMIVENEKRLLIAKIEHVSRAYIYEYDKGELTQVAFVSFSGNLAPIRFLTGNNNASYFSIGNGYLYKINDKNGVFFLHNLSDTFENGVIINAVLDERSSKNVGDLRIFVRDTDADGSYIVLMTPDNSIVSGMAVTSIIDLGPHMPAYLAAKHAPLTATASLVVNARYDKAGSYSTILISDTTGAVRECIKISDLIDNTVHYIELQIFLLDSAGLFGINEVELNYLYIPTGIENSN